MKIFAVCAQCMRDDIENADMALVEPNSAGFYKFTCSKGHQSFHVPQESDFEILFEIGCYAIVDGYYREAVSTFSAALERFYEFYLNLVYRKKKIDKDFYIKSWKEVSNQSERQLGAFIFAWLLENKENPEVLRQKQREFRNDVIHKGFIPSRDQAVNFGQAVLDLISSQIKTIKTNYKDEIHEYICNLQFERIAKIPKGAARTSGVQGFTLSIVVEEDKKLTLSNELVRIARKRESFIKQAT